MTGDGDDGVLLDPIFFAQFSRSSESPFNKTSRLRSLDGFNLKNFRNYNMISLPRLLYTYGMRVCILHFSVKFTSS